MIPAAVLQYVQLLEAQCRVHAVLYEIVIPFRIDNWVGNINCRGVTILQNGKEICELPSQTCQPILRRKQ